MSSIRVKRSDRLTTFAKGAVATAAVSAAVFTTGCSSTATNATEGNPDDYRATVASMSDSETDEILQTAFLTPDIGQDQLDPVIVQGLQEIGQEYSPDQQQRALSCLDQPTCTIGDGEQTLAILDGNGQDLWRRITRAAITLHATAYPNIGTVMYLQADGNLQTMQSQLQTLITRGVTGIVSYNDFGPAMTAAYQQATNRGIPVVAYGGTPGPDAIDAVVSQVQPSFCDAGNQMASATLEMIGETGRVAYFTGTPGNPQGEGWQQCATEWFAENAPGIEVVSRSNTNWTEAGATSAASALIASGRDVDAVLNDYARQTPNIIQAYKQAQLPVPAQVTWTSDNATLGMWEQDAESERPWRLGYSSSINFGGNIALAVLMNHLAGEEVPSEVIFPLPFVEAQMGDYKPDEPPNSPGPTVLPDEYLTNVLT